VSYFIAILFLITLHSVGGKIAIQASKEGLTNRIFLRIVVIIAMLVGEVVLLSNGITRLVEM